MLIKLLHDQDGHIEGRHSDGAHEHSAEGLKLRNSRGEEWLTRCDGQLFLYATRDAASTPAVEAIAASVTELLVARCTGELPTGPYAATAWIGWPAPSEKTLVQKFPLDTPENVKAALARGKPYLKVLAGLRQKHVEALFTTLPQRMKELRKRIVADIDGSEELRNRLHPALLDACRSIAWHPWTIV